MAREGQVRRQREEGKWNMAEGEWHKELRIKN